ncbi:TrbC/VirB2 family protein [Sphingopyxis sp. LARHCG72]
MYSPDLSLTDPPARSALVDGIIWVQGAALGSVATALAVIAVAAIGLLMLSGRLEVRRGITVVLGCFILFGSAGIAAALTGLAGADTRPSLVATQDPGPLSSTVRPATPPSRVYDPYAGASVPSAR